MAEIQQNSTLIDDNKNSSSSILHLPEVINHCSPILPLKSVQYNKINKDNLTEMNDEKHDNDKICHISYHFNTKVHARRNLNKYSVEENHLKKCNRNTLGGGSHRSRSVSLYGVNSTTGQGHKEIPIWIDDEPRYVSGVTNKTTCNDIIKALIEDEILNGNNAYHDAASRDYSDYVITESWRGIERSYNGAMTLLPVWKAWSRVHNELRLSLRHNKDIMDLPQIQHKNKNQIKIFAKIRKLFSRFFRFGKKRGKPVTSAQMASGRKSSMKSENCAVLNSDETPDEILFVILPDKLYEKDGLDKLVISDSIPPAKMQSVRKLNEKNFFRRTDDNQKRFRRRNVLKRCQKNLKSYSKNKPHLNLNQDNCVPRRKTVSFRSSIRNRLAQKTCKVDELYKREYALTKELTHKFQLYRMHNELYKNPEKQLELSIGHIQRSVEDYAQEIIQTEHKLLDLKNEIKHDISIINRLKRMSLATNSTDCQIVNDQSAGSIQTITKPENIKMPDTQQMHFVDNIYEFCDNNASMLV